MDKRICFTLLCWGLCVGARSISTQTSTIKPLATDPDRRDYYNQPRVIEQFNHRNPDGSYEFRYELDDGNTRYERGYFLTRNNEPSLVVTGYYAYRLDDGRYTTVFYNADHNGYRQQASTTSQGWPDLPRTIDVDDQNLTQNVIGSSSDLKLNTVVENSEQNRKESS